MLWESRYKKTQKNQSLTIRSQPIVKKLKNKIFNLPYFVFEKSLIDAMEFGIRPIVFAYEQFQYILTSVQCV